MNTTKSQANNNMSQWKDAKVSGGSKTELTRAVAQIRSQVKDEYRIFAASVLSFGTKNKPPK
jgi:hypothetical protein